MYFLKKKNMMASVAQVLLAVILLPMICMLLNVLIPDNCMEFLLNLVGELPVWSEIVEIIIQLIVKIQSSSNVDFLFFYNALIKAIQYSILEAVILGLCVYACKAIGTMLYIRGIPVLQALFGILLGTITLKAMENDDIVKYTSFLFLIVLDVVLTLFEASGQLLKKILGVLIGMGTQSLIAGLSAGYVLVLAYILSGSIKDLSVIVALLMIILIPLICFLCLDYVLFTAIKS